MKKVFMTLGLTMFMGAAVFAQTQQGTGTQQGTTTDRMNQEQRDQDKKDKDKKDIDKSDLPEEVKNAFDESQYSSWNVEDIWEMDSNEQATAAQGQAGQTGQAGASMDGKTYLIKVKDSDDKAVGLHYDASGTLLETKTDMDKKDKKDKKKDY